jgi:hypothetical protein
MIPAVDRTVAPVEPAGTTTHALRTDDVDGGFSPGGASADVP